MTNFKCSTQSSFFCPVLIQVFIYDTDKAAAVWLEKLQMQDNGPAWVVFSFLDLLRVTHTHWRGGVLNINNHKTIRITQAIPKTVICQFQMWLSLESQQYKDHKQTSVLIEQMKQHIR